MRDVATRNYDLPYETFIKSEGIPIHRAALGVSDVTALSRERWSRTGGLGTFIELEGTFQSERGLDVGEIPARSELQPQVHLYEEQVYILSGRGTTTVWQGSEDQKHFFEWQRGSIFAVPPNVTYVLGNLGNEPVVYLGVTTAPRLMNSLYDVAAVFTSTHKFVDLAV